MVVGRRRRGHEVSILIASGAGVGRWLGSQPRVKLSMMIIRPPQQGHGRGSMRGWSASGVASVSRVALGGLGREQVACACDLGSTFHWRTIRSGGCDGSRAAGHG